MIHEIDVYGYNMKTIPTYGSDSEESSAQDDEFDTEAVESSLSDANEESESETDLGELQSFWQKLEETKFAPAGLQSLPNPASVTYPRLTDMVMKSTDVVLRPFTVIRRVYPISPYHRVSPLPKILPNRLRSR